MRPATGLEMLGTAVMKTLQLSTTSLVWSLEIREREQKHTPQEWSLVSPPWRRGFEPEDDCCCQKRPKLITSVKEVVHCPQTCQEEERCSPSHSRRSRGVYGDLLTGLIEENDTLLQQLSQISESVAIKETSWSADKEQKIYSRRQHHSQYYHSIHETAFTSTYLLSLHAVDIQACTHLILRKIVLFHKESRRILTVVLVYNSVISTAIPPVVLE